MNCMRTHSMPNTNNIAGILRQGRYTCSESFSLVSGSVTSTFRTAKQPPYIAALVSGGAGIGGVAQNRDEDTRGCAVVGVPHTMPGREDWRRHGGGALKEGRRGLCGTDICGWEKELVRLQWIENEGRRWKLPDTSPANVPNEPKATVGIWVSIPLSNNTSGPREPNTMRKILKEKRLSKERKCFAGQ